MPMIDYLAVNRLLDIQDVLDMIGWTPTYQTDAAISGKTAMRGKCPFHPSGHAHSRSFAVAADGSGFCCHAKSCGLKGNALYLYTLVTKLPLYVAAKEICRAAGVPLPLKNAEQRRGTIKGGPDHAAN